MKKTKIAAAAVVAAIGLTGSAFAGMDEAQKWIDGEFQPSTLSKAEQLTEMKWFIDAAAPFQ